MHPPTVEDVARAAGVSRQTVSNVLNAPERVRPETRQRVEAAIDQLGYRPNRVAQSLRASTSRMIGYRIEPMHPQSLSSIHDRFLHALAEAGRAADHHLLLFTANDPEDEVANVQALHRAGAIDGVILYGISTADPRPPGLRQLRIPFAAFGRTGADSAHSWVDIDNAAGTAAAVDHLVAGGHRRIAFVGYPEGAAAVGDRRAEGWRTGLDRHGLLAGSRHLDLRGEDSLATGAWLGEALLDHPTPPTAVVAATDTLAAGVLRVVQRRGARLAVVGFDDTPTAAALDLSSVRQPIEAVGHAMIRALLGGGTEPTAQLLPPELIVRASSAPQLNPDPLGATP
ncbi:LacI family DNA-binding transcriptional regulator [Dactylosporangium sucinum]|uniref:Alanine racemase n=1 Tax=Dactylosporangium sucinum TaxID=1424081 RepID=A0A917WPX4_9ACTN|nr:LacI family DNA-binding transcriptional regulator [Dactylosporangium sucinum]GGM19753.1 alanine racemase [Dactylosporangium sucinum]